ncbi:MAG: TolB family protein [Desulfonatronovibrionaceae bacterium]
MNILCFKIIRLICCAAFFLGLSLLFAVPPNAADNNFSTGANGPQPIDIIEPLNGTIYPPDMAAPFFLWRDGEKRFKYVLEISRSGQSLFRTNLENSWWIPDKKTWEKIRAKAGLDQIKLSISGRDQNARKIASRGEIDFRFAKDRVNARVMFMRKPLPFAKAQKNPEQTELVPGDIGSYNPPTPLMKSPPICANCHAYSARGEYLTLDTDFAGDKGAFLFTPFKEKIRVDTKTVNSWNSMGPVDPAPYSMGLFARVSPSGRYIAGTVGETSVFVKMNDLFFSQLFFPATGKIAVFAARTEDIGLLPGAAKEDMVQTAPAWSPDGQTLAFSATPVKPELIQKVRDKTVFNESPDQNILGLNKKYPVQFDIYTLPFNRGKGGTAKPLEGASNNGDSNYFPRYSPNGKWIVYTRSPTGLVLQPYSKLYIVSAIGGKARELECNRPVMNSWHSWSPNSRWLVFTSKANSPFTELYLTHIDEQGKASPAIRLFRFSRNDLAAMVPEFIPDNASIPESIAFDPGAQGESMATDGR